MVNLRDHKKLFVFEKRFTCFAGILLILLCVFSCNNLFISGGGSLIIAVPGARAATASSFTIELTGSNGTTQSKTVSGGSTVQFDDLAPDTYRISVKAADDSGAVVLYGTSDATVTAGATASATVKMSEVVNDYGSLSNAISTGGIVYIGSDIDVDSTLTVNTDVTLLPFENDVILKKTDNIVLISVSAAGTLTVGGNDYTITLDGAALENDSNSLINANGSGSTVYLNRNSIVTNNSGTGLSITGVNTTSKAYLYLNGGTISNNKAGGVSLSSAEFVMNDGSIESNTSTQGAGVNMTASNASFVMKGGNISNNNSTGNGGGVNVTGGSKFTMEGGSIKGNSATGTGKGVNFAGSGFLKMSGSAVIDSSNEVYLSANCKITITGKLTGAPSVATITPRDYSLSTQVLSTENGVTLANEVGKFAVTQNPADGSEWTIDPNTGNLVQ